MPNLNVILGFALCVSLLINLATSNIRFLLTALVLLLCFLIFTPPVVRRVAQLLRNGLWKLLEDRLLQLNAIIRETIAHVMDTTSTLAVRVVCAVQAKYESLREILQLFEEKVRLIFKGEHGSYEDNENTKHLPIKVVLLVSIPYGRSYSAMKSELGLNPPEPPLIDRESNQKGSLPSLLSLGTSIRHFALCIVPLDVWDCKIPTISQRLHQGKFWELIGPDVQPREGECVRWGAERIGNIDSMVEVGLVCHSDAYISEQFYRPLRDAWDNYQVVWWNSYDFSIRLAFLLQYVRKKDNLGEIRHRIEGLRAVEVMKSEQKLAIKGQFLGMKGFVTGWTLTAGSTCLLPVVPVAFPAIALGLWAFSVGSGLYGVCLSSREKPGYAKQWRKLAKRVEEKLPQLRGLLDA